MSVGSIILNRIIPSLLFLAGIKENTWKAKKYNAVLQSLLMIPVKRIKGFRRTSKLVEKQYDQISGLYIQDNYYVGRMRHSVVDGEVKYVSSIDNMQAIRAEIRDVLAEFEFSNVLEVGVGELTTLEDVYRSFGPELDCYGVDLSLNRMRHGIEEFKKRHDRLPKVAKANAMHLPFLDNSFDLVITRHTLEQMPTIYQRALDEILRVARKHVVLFEPSFELGTFAQKLKMLNNDYVRGIPVYLSGKRGLQLEPAYLMKNSANPLNHTACYRIKIDLPELKISDDPDTRYVCPISKGILEKRDSYYYSKKGERAYPVIEDIPVLDPDYSIGLSSIEG